jgi:adenylate cyclase
MCSLSGRFESGPIGDALLGGPPRYRKAEVAKAAGIEVARAERLWQALGFAHVDDDDVVFTDADVTALCLLTQLVSADIVRPELETAMTRAVGQSMSRLAEWDVAIVKSVLGQAFSTDVETTAQFVQEVTPVMAQILEYVWRRHLAATVDRELDTAAGDERTLVIGFADIVGYTRLIRSFSQIALDGLLEEFEDIANAVIAENHGRTVKTVGDEVLFVADSATDGAEIALTLNERVDASDRLPPLRIGVARGIVLARFGDVYGSTVNVASRLTSVARPASVLVDRELAAALRDVSRYRLVPLGPRKVQGFSGLRAWALRRSSSM